MKIQLNGRPHEVRPGTTLQALVNELGLATDRVAVERNREVVRRAELDRQTLEEGDRIEVVQFVGGG
jgi:thiamine biosynthesis protein ThiS